MAGVLLRALQSQKQHLEKKMEREQVMLAALPESSVPILELASEHGRARVAETARVSGASRNTIKDHLKALVEQGHLTRHCSGAGHQNARLEAASMQIGGNCRNRLSFENRQRLIGCPCLSESRPNLRCPKQPAYLGKGREEGGCGSGRPKYSVNEVDGIVVRAVEIDRLSQTCQRRGRRRDHTEQSVGDRDATTDARRAETLTVEKTTDNHLLVKPISPSNPDRNS